MSQFLVLLRPTLRRPFLPLAASLSIALSGALAACLFAVFDQAVLHVVPGPTPERIVAIAYGAASSSTFRSALSLTGISDLRSRTDTLEALGWSIRINALPLNGSSDSVNAVIVSSGFFDVFAVQPSVGALQTAVRPADDEPVVVLSMGAWQRVFGASRDAIGGAIRLGDRRYRVAAVMPAAFTVPSPTVEAWIVDERSDLARGGRNLLAVGRVREGLTAQSAGVELHQRTPTEATESGQDLEYVVASLRDQLAGPVSGTAMPLFGAVLLITLLVCANAAVMSLVRTIQGRSDLLIRISLGASLGNLSCRAVFEPLLYSFAGAIAGIVLTQWGTTTLRSLAPSAFPRLAVVSLDARTIAFVLGCALACGLSAMIGPLAWTRRTFREAQEASAQPRRPALALHTLIATQVAVVVSTALVASAALSTVMKVSGVDLGFESRDLYALLVRTPPFDAAQTKSDALVRSLRAIPGIEAVGIGTMLSVGKVRPFHTSLAVETHDGVWKPMTQIEYQSVNESYFSTLGTRLLQGRSVTAGDMWGSPCVVVVNSLFAADAWPNQVPLGKHVDLAVNSGGVRQNTQHLCEVVGVVGNTRSDLEAPAGPQVYFSFRQRPETMQALLIRSKPGHAIPLKTIEELAVTVGLSRQQVWSGALDPLVRRAVIGPRFYATLATACFLCCIALAAAGIYGVNAYAVTLRHREFGVRLALGANRERLPLLALRGSIVASTIGCGGGMFSGYLLLASIRSSVQDLPENSWALNLTVGLAAALMILTAGFVAARRVRDIVPSELLRS